jgi:hypothetical protein
MNLAPKTRYAIGSALGFALVAEIFGVQMGINAWNQFALVVFSFACVFNGLKSLQEK